MRNTLFYLRNRLAETLWLRPLVMCIVSVIALGIAYYAGTWIEDGTFPEITPGSLKMLLGVLTSGMLVIATFAAGAMISAYASASNTATPRAFPIIVADDVSQNALSTFVGAFLFAVIALLAIMNEAFSSGGRFLLLLLTLAVFWVVVMTFIRWVDRIARLGRLGMTLDQVEQTVSRSIRHYQTSWVWNCPASPSPLEGTPVFGSSIGYLQRTDWSRLQEIAEEAELEIEIHVLPGKFITPDLPLATLSRTIEPDSDLSPLEEIKKAFHIGTKRIFDEDPRFGFVVLSEIASRALSPAINDPGTAIQIIGQFVRLLHLWKNPPKSFDPEDQAHYDRIRTQPIALSGIFEDAFLGIERNGADCKEVMIRLQKAYLALGAMDDELRTIADQHAQQALRRAEQALTFDEDFLAIKAVRDQSYTA
ncbi:MAG: DUF2254 domain-containing protein [Puniceicoccales bacterium]